MAAELYLYRGVAWEIEPNLPVSPGFDRYTARRVTDTAWTNAGAGARVPRIADLELYYQRDPRRCDLPLDAATLARTKVADCKSLSALWLGRKLQKGDRPTMRIEGSGRSRLIHVRPVQVDPSRVLRDFDLYKDGRREPGPECVGWKPYVPGEAGCSAAMCEAGEEVQVHRDEERLHPNLQAVLRRGREAGLPVYLVSGHRPTERQIRLWEARMGRAGAPSSWADVEAHWSRWWRWVDDEATGAGSGPPLALPGLSDHQRDPADAADLGARADSKRQRDEILGKLAAITSDLATRPMSVEPWHFKARE